MNKMETTQQVYNISRNDFKDIDTSKILTGYFRVREGKGDGITTLSCIIPDGALKWIWEVESLEQVLLKS